MFERLHNYVYAIVGILQYFLFPKMQAAPASLFQQGIVTFVPGHVLFDFFYPVIPVGFEPGFTVFPLVPMPKLTINKDGYLMLSDGYIWRTGELFIVQPVSEAAPP